MGEDGVSRLLKVTPTEIPRAASSPPYRALFVEDITELERYERELRERQAALRALFVNEEAIRTEERTRLSRDIHDVLGQMLTAHKMDLHWIKSNKEENKYETIAEMIGHIDEMIVFVKRVCSELRDNVLDVFGFDAALDEHLKQFRERNGIEVELITDGTPVDLGREREVSLLRIIQESLTNIVRHANASKILVSCRYSADGVTWTIRDNGRGFDRHAVAGKGSLGLVGMNERAVSWGGSVEIHSEPGDGTTVEVSIPLAQEAG
jgi:signal transduction histidine kinase